MTALIVTLVAGFGLAAFALERWASNRLHRIRRARYRQAPPHRVTEVEYPAEWDRGRPPGTWGRDRFGPGG